MIHSCMRLMCFLHLWVIWHLVVLGHFMMLMVLVIHFLRGENLYWSHLCVLYSYIKVLISFKKRNLLTFLFLLMLCLISKFLACNVVLTHINVKKCNAVQVLWNRKFFLCIWLTLQRVVFKVCENLLRFHCTNVNLGWEANFIMFWSKASDDASQSCYSKQVPFLKSEGALKSKFKVCSENATKECCKFTSYLATNPIFCV